jgi:hypothetical protein
MFYYEGYLCSTSALFSWCVYGYQILYKSYRCKKETLHKIQRCRLILVILISKAVNVNHQKYSTIKQIQKNTSWNEILINLQNAKFVIVRSSHSLENTSNKHKTCQLVVKSNEVTFQSWTIGTKQIAKRNYLDHRNSLIDWKPRIRMERSSNLHYLHIDTLIDVWLLEAWSINLSYAMGDSLPFISWKFTVAIRKK